jgi:hypothetical protein
MKAKFLDHRIWKRSATDLRVCKSSGQQSQQDPVDPRREPQRPPIQGFQTVGHCPRIVNAGQRPLQIVKGESRGVKASARGSFAPLAQCFYPLTPSSLCLVLGCKVHSPSRAGHASFEWPRVFRSTVCIGQSRK